MYQSCGGVQLQSFGLEVNFELRDNPITELSFCIKLGCIWDCGSECILVVVYLCMGSGSRISVMFGG